MLHKILNEVNQFYFNTSYLKQHSDYYPEVLIDNRDKENVAVSTLVRKFHEGQWWIIHCVERAQNESGALKRLHLQVCLIQHFHIPFKLDEIDKDQTPEDERLKTRYLNFNQG